MNKVKKAELVAKARADMKHYHSTWDHRNNSCEGTGSSGTFNNACFGGIDSAGHKYQENHACHRPVMDWEDLDVYWNCFGWRKTNEVSGPYYLAWLMETSPWAKQGIFPKECTLQSVSEDQGFIFTNVREVSGNLFHNFLVATRMPTEWSYFIKAWHELVTTHKCNPELAFVFMDCFRPTTGWGHNGLWLHPEVMSMPTAEDKYDWPLDVATSVPEYVWNFTHHKAPDASKVPFSPTAWHRPINAVWGRRTFDPGKNQKGPDTPAKRISSDETYTEFLDRTYRGKYAVKGEVPKQKSTFGQSSKLSYGETFSSTKLYKADAIIEILKQEEIRLGLK